MKRKRGDVFGNQRYDSKTDDKARYDTDGFCAQNGGKTITCNLLGKWSEKTASRYSEENVQGIQRFSRLAFRHERR